MNSNFDNQVDFTKINLPGLNDNNNNDNNDDKSSSQNNNQVMPPRIKEQVDILDKFDKLTKDFNKNKNTSDKNMLIKIVKQMREIHGNIIKSFYDQLKLQGNFNHEEFFVLSTLDTSYNNMRNVIKQAESIIAGTKYDDNVLSNIHLNGNISQEHSTESKKSKDSSLATDLSKYAKTNINSELPTIILFYMDWCGHCMHFKPIWNEFSKITDKKYINVVKTDNDELVTKYKIEGFPTVKLFIDDQVINYEGDRSVGGLADFINAILDVQASKPLAAN